MKYLKYINIFIIAIIVLFFGKFLFHTTPFAVTLEIISDSPLNIQFFYDWKPISKKVFVPQNSDKSISLNLGLNFLPDNVHILFSDVNAPVTINDIRTNKSFVIEDFENFSSPNAKTEIKNNRLIITPNKNNFWLVYKIPNETVIEGKNKFDLIPVILAILYLLIILAKPVYKKIIIPLYKDFGSNPAKIFYLSVFFAILCCPIIHMKYDIKSVQDRIIFDTYPKIIKDCKFNMNFGKEFNKWFNFNFGFRKNILYIHNLMIYKLLSGEYYEDKKTIYNKTADFTFNKQDINIFLKQKTFTEQQLKKIYDNILQFKNYCDKNNVKLYIFLADAKESIYPELYPKYYHQYKNPSKTEQIMSIFSKIPGLIVISAKKELLEAKTEEPVLICYDLHYSPKGNYITYHKLISEIRKAFPFITPVKYSEITAKPTFYFSNLPPLLINRLIQIPSDISVTEPKFSLTDSYINSNEQYELYTFKNDKLHYKLDAVIIGDSFQERFKETAAENFSSYKSLLLSPDVDFEMDDNAKTVLFNEKPDIIILECNEIKLDRFLNIDSLFDIFDKKYKSK